MESLSNVGIFQRIEGKGVYCYDDTAMVVGLRERKEVLGQLKEVWVRKMGAEKILTNETRKRNKKPKKPTEKASCFGFFSFNYRWKDIQESKEVPSQLVQINVMNAQTTQNNTLALKVDTESCTTWRYWLRIISISLWNRLFIQHSWKLW